MQILKKLLGLLPKKIINVSVSSIPSNSILSSRCAMITGGTSGIGFAIAEAFLRSGASVIITGRSKERLNDSLLKLRSRFNGAVALGYVLNNTEVDSFEDIFKQMVDGVSKSGITGVDILVNNAGVNFKGMPNATEEEYDIVMDTNLKGTFFLSQMFGKYLIANGIKGNILNIASASSLRPADSAYTLSKWGLRGLTLGLAKSLAKYGITVNGIAPGPTATPMMLKGETSNMTLDRIPLGRYITPEEIANMALFLVSDMGRSIMGDIVYMTGGAGLLTYDDVNYSF